MRAIAPTLCLLLLASCSEKSSGAASGSSDNGGGGDIKLVGVDLDRWSCDLIATPAMMSEVLGIPARGVDSTLGSAPGTPKPCNFVAEGAAPEAWSFDFDCRDNALKT